MAGNVQGQRRFAEQSFQEVTDGQQSSGSDAETSPVPSTTFSDFNDAASKADTESLPAWNSSWSLADDSHTPTIADPQNEIHPDWIVPSSPPSPPLRYDPRVRAASPETPSPLYAKWQKPAIRKVEPSKVNTPSRLGTSTQLPSDAFEQVSDIHDGVPSLDSQPVSRASSLISSSSYSSTSASDNAEARPVTSVPHIAPLPFQPFSRQFHAFIPLPPAYPGQRLQPSTSSPFASTSAQNTSTAQSGNAAPLNLQFVNRSEYTNWQNPPVSSQASTSLHWRQEAPRTIIQSYSTALGAQARPGLAKLSRFREPTSSGKKRVRAPAKHAHKRSCSVQWQQFERWQSKSRARLRDLLLLLLAMTLGTFVIWQLCFASARPASTSRRRITIKIPPLATLPEPHRNTMAIYRILGNDLPPRHEVGQTLRNLRFMLSHEDDFSHFSSPSFSPYNIKIDKYYVLNRITNDTAVEAITKLFTEFGVPHSRILNIPFELEEYKRQSMRWDGGVAGSKNLWGIGAPGTRNMTAEIEMLQDSDIPDTFEMKEKRLKRALMTKLRAMEYATHDKNLYAINNNGGRNYALAHGQSLPNSRWILPLDGNCFLTPLAMASLIQTMASEAEGEGSKRHVIVPMNRLLNNQDVFDDNAVPWTSDNVRLQDLDVEPAYAPEEPQIGFRWDSPISYQPSMRYGRRSKLELLWRLGAIPFSRGLHIKRLPWEKQDQLYITPHSYASAVNASIPQRQTSNGISNGDFAKAGWVHRLFSGDTSQEHSTTRAAELRRLNRMRGIVAYLESLDLKASESSVDKATLSPQDRLWHCDSRYLNKQRDHRLAQAKDEAEELLQASSKLAERASRHAASQNPEAFNQIAKEALHFALAGYLTSNEGVLLAALKAMRSMIPAPSTIGYQIILEYGQPPVGYAFPTMPAKLLESPQRVVLPYNPFEVVITPVLDILRLVRLSGHQKLLDSTDRKWVQDMQAVFERHLRVLLLSNEATELSSRPPSFEAAIRYDTSVAALSSYFNIPSLVSRVSNRHHLRYLDPATGEPAFNFDSHTVKDMYNTFKTGLDNVALDGRTKETLSSVHSIIDNLLR